MAIQYFSDKARFPLFNKIALCLTGASAGPPQEEWAVLRPWICWGVLTLIWSKILIDRLVCYKLDNLDTRCYNVTNNNWRSNMPVIRVDDEVWKELQRKAEPLVDTPNSVLRRILELTAEEVSNEGKVIEIELSHLYTSQKYVLIPVSRKKRRFFPGYNVYFDLETDTGAIRTRVTSAPKGTPSGDRNGGNYIKGGLRPWYNNHPELKSGDRLRFEALEPGKKYRLSVLQG